MGIEPATCGLQNRCSTIELRRQAHYIISLRLQSQVNDVETADIAMYPRTRWRSDSKRATSVLWGTLCYIIGGSRLLVKSHRKISVQDSVQALDLASAVLAPYP